MNKKLGIALVVIAIIAISGLVLPVGKDGKTVVQKIGAVSGPEVTSPYFSVNGVNRWYNRVAVNAASTTLCSIKSPAATSTLVSAMLKLDTSTTSAYAIEMGQATNYYSTTTLIGTKSSQLAGAKVTLVASTTPTAAEVTTFAPNTWFVAKWFFVTAGGATGNSAVGVCQATFESI